MSVIDDRFSVIKFEQDGGPIVIEVTSGYSSLGSFILAFSEIEGTDYYEFGKDPKRIDDDHLDMFHIPIVVKRISKYVLFVIGKYSPAPGHKQIRVKYDFAQDGKLLEVEPKNGNVIKESTSKNVLRFTHYFTFKPKDV